MLVCTEEVRGEVQLCLQPSVKQKQAAFQSAVGDVIINEIMNVEVSSD